MSDNTKAEGLDASVKDQGHSGSLLEKTARIAAALIIMCMGVVFLLFPIATGLSAAAVVPFVLFVVGIVGIVYEIFAVFRSGMKFDWLIFIYSLVYAALGLLLAASIFDAVFALSVVVAVGFVAQAILAVAAIFTQKGHRLWMAFLAVCSIGLAYIAFMQWPYGAMELVGICIGFSVISWGASLGWGKIRG